MEQLEIETFINTSSLLAKLYINMVLEINDKYIQSFWIQINEYLIHRLLYPRIKIPINIDIPTQYNY